MARLLGIDIGTSAVRIAMIRTSYRKTTVEALDDAPISPEGGVKMAIRAAVAAHRPDHIAVALPGELAFVRRLEIPAAAQKELNNVLSFELESTVPVDVEGAVFDHRVLKHRPAPELLAVLAGIARTEDVQARIDLVRDAIGREPECVALGPLPLASLTAILPTLEGTTPEDQGPVAILELSEFRSEVVCVQGGEAAFVRTLSRGTRGLPHTAKDLARELKQTFLSYRANSGTTVKKLYLVGGGASVQGAEVFMANELGLPVVPLPEPMVEGLTPEQRARFPLYAKAIGLALGLDSRNRALNLRQGALAAARAYPFLREKIPLLSGLAAVIAVSFGFSIIAEMRSLEVERELLDAKLSQVTGEVLGEPTTDTVKVREILESGGTIKSDPMPKADAFDVMVQLADAVPEEIAHDIVEFDVSTNAAGVMHTTIQGTVPIESDAGQTAEQIAQHLSQHECFKNVKVGGTSQFNSERHKYTIELDVRCEDAKKPADGKGKDANADESGGDAQ